MPDFNRHPASKITLGDLNFIRQLPKFLAELRQAIVQKAQKGDKGDKGDSVVGPRGSQGLQGLQGRTGMTGAVGPRGFTGPRGKRGDVGLAIKGDKGDRGEQGPAGLDGKPGKRGAQGSPGVDGIDGLDGEDGKPGKDGKDAVFNEELLHPPEQLGTVMVDEEDIGEGKLLVYKGDKLVYDSVKQVTNIQRLGGGGASQKEAYQYALLHC